MPLNQMSFNLKSLLDLLKPNLEQMGKLTHYKKKKKSSLVHLVNFTQ